MACVYRYKGKTYHSLEEVKQLLVNDKLAESEANSMLPTSSYTAEEVKGVRPEIVRLNESIPKYPEGEFPGKQLTIRDENCR